MTIVAEDMRAKLVSLDDLREKLEATEPLTSHTLEADKTHFVLEPNWADGLDLKAGTDTVQAFVSIGDAGGAREFQLTKDALQAATSYTGINTAYAARTPAPLIEPQLNYWFNTGFSGNKAFKLLALGDQLGAAVTRNTIEPFSNLRLLDESLDKIHDVYGSSDVLVDYKLVHSLRSTVFRLIVPEQTRALVTGTPEDNWSMGLQIKNSLTGEGQTEINGYLFRWWCTNGMTDTHTESGVWSRRSGAANDEVYSWAAHAVDEVLGGLEHSLDAVQALTEIPLHGEANEVLRDVFSQYKVPQATRDRIIANMVESEDLTMYSLMAAVTEVANRDDVDPRHANSLLQIGGELVHRAHARCNDCHRLLEV
jgi:hypothetical protein